MPDIRFAKIGSDPRFRRPRKKQAKIVLDDRFKTIFTREQRSKQSDKYGRNAPDVHENAALKRFYRLEKDEDVEDLPYPDFARGEVLLESSDEEDTTADGEATLRTDDTVDPTIPSVLNEPDLEIDLDEATFAGLDAQAAAYAAENSESNEPGGEPTTRLAAVNLDWDYIRAIHLFKICSSLLSPVAPLANSDGNQQKKDREVSGSIARGTVISVRIYPSEFGEERMAREDIEGPPSEIFKKRVNDDEINEQNIYDIRDQDDYDNDALRDYQLERLRYYYAIITCDTIDAAAHIYSELEGTELERSANVFNLSYVPDDMVFDQEFRDQATAETNIDYERVDFVTDALRHSKVKLTWEEDDPERNRLTRRALSKQEIENADFRAYLASSSESELEVVQASVKPNLKNKQVSRDKLRTLLLSGSGHDLPEGWDHDNNDTRDVDLQITFTPGLSEKKEENTLDKYQRKIKERRRQKKDNKVTHPKPDDEADDDFFDAEDETLGGRRSTTSRQNHSGGQKHGWVTSKQAKRPISTAEELALLAASDDLDSQPNHFNLKSVLKAEKKTYQKKKSDKDHDDNEAQSSFVINVNDERFKVLHEDHQFAIDPTNPQFKKTKAMDEFLKERSRRQKTLGRGGATFVSTDNQIKSEERDLAKLVKSVKRRGFDRFDTAGKRPKLN